MQREPQSADNKPQDIPLALLLPSILRSPGRRSYIDTGAHGWVSRSIVRRTGRYHSSRNIHFQEIRGSSAFDRTEWKIGRDLHLPSPAERPCRGRWRPLLANRQAVIDLQTE